MKKLLSLLIAAALIFTFTLALVSCKEDNGDDNSNSDNSNDGNSNTNDDNGSDNTDNGDDTPKTLYDLFAEMKPTKTVTLVSYTTADGELLEGYYSMEIEGDDSIFDFYYDKYRTSQEAIDDNDPSKIKRVAGTVYCKDGKYSGDGVLWGASPVATDIKLTLKEELFKVAIINKEGNTLTAQVDPENAAAVFGTDLAAEGIITLILQSNNTYITRLTVNYTTEDGATVQLQTSYSYNALSLVFPDSVYQ